MNPLIYHYCSTNTAEQIIRGGKLWFSDITKMNDPKEYEHGFELLKSSSLINSSVLNQIQMGQQFQIFSASFSTESDCLTLWRLYGDNSKGVAIGFDRDELQQTSLFSRYEQAMQPVIGNIQFFDVSYQDSFLDKVRHYLSLCVGAREVLLTPALIRLCYTHKNQSYSDERELRAVAELSDQVTSYNPQTRDGLYGKTNYCEVPTRYNSFSAIKEIVFGPQFDKKEGSNFCDSLRIREPNVVTKHSSISYR
jgi:hypothetical protein